MSSYLSNLLTTTTSRYNSLRRNLLNDEADGDTEDDSHLSRVLRAYYTEKGRPFPPWLPPDLKAPQQVPTQFVSSSGRQPGQQPGSIGRGGGLSDLWDAPQQSQQQQEPVSLRRAQGRGGGGPRFQGRLGAANSYSPEPQAQGRPLPSQREGSYQSASAFGRPAADPSPPASSGSGVTAQERLKARLWGSGRSNSPVQSTATSSNNSSPRTTPTLSQAGQRNPYERPSQGQPSASYPDDRGGYAAGGGGGGGRNPYTSSNSPWSSGGDDPYGGGGGYVAPRPGRDRVGLPNGPRPR